MDEAAMNFVRASNSFSRHTKRAHLKHGLPYMYYNTNNWARSYQGMYQSPPLASDTVMRVEHSASSNDSKPSEQMHTAMQTGDSFSDIALLLEIQANDQLTKKFQGQLDSQLPLQRQQPTMHESLSSINERWVAVTALNKAHAREEKAALKKLADERSELAKEIYRKWLLKKQAEMAQRSERRRRTPAMASIVATTKQGAVLRDSEHTKIRKIEHVKAIEREQDPLVVVRKTKRQKRRAVVAEQHAQLDELQSLKMPKLKQKVYEVTRQKRHNEQYWRNVAAKAFKKWYGWTKHQQLRRHLVNHKTHAPHEKNTEKFSRKSLCILYE